METKIPLINRIRREAHKQIAIAQDIIIEEVYKFLNSPVFHGGTSIWRCYSGKRFSEDMDFYFMKEKTKINLLFESLKKKGFEIGKKKISERSVYSELIFNRVSVRLEATFQRVKGQLIDYERVDGNIISIYGLTPENLIKEKSLTYLKRGKIRDLYDVFFLLRLINNIEIVKDDLKKLINKYSSPVDETELKAIILEGVVPKSEDMIDYIKRKWENPNI